MYGWIILAIVVGLLILAQKYLTGLKSANNQHVPSANKNPGSINTPMPLLRLTMTFDWSDHFEIKEKRLHPEFKPIEYIRFPLHYISKMLFNYGSTGQEEQVAVKILLMWLGMILRGEPTNDFQAILERSQIDDLAENNDVLRGKTATFSGTLFFLSAVFRGIQTDIPPIGMATYQHSNYSVIILTAYCASKLEDKDDINRLFAGLNYMHQQYSAGRDFSDMEVLNGLPNEAYINTTFESDPNTTL